MVQREPLKSFKSTDSPFPCSDALSQVDGSDRKLRRRSPSPHSLVSRLSLDMPRRRGRAAQGNIVTFALNESSSRSAWTDDTVAESRAGKRLSRAPCGRTEKRVLCLVSSTRRAFATPDTPPAALTPSAPIPSTSTWGSSTSTSQPPAPTSHHPLASTRRGRARGRGRASRRRAGLQGRGGKVLATG